MNGKNKFLVYSSVIGYSVFLLIPLFVSIAAIYESINPFSIIIVLIDTVLILPLILFLKKRESARIILGIYSIVLFILLAFSPIVQHEIDLTLGFYILYCAYLSLFAYIFFIMLVYKGTKQYFMGRG